MIRSQEFYADRKRVTVELRENRAGQFLRITEGRRGMVLIPLDGLEDFIAALEAVAG